MPIRYARCFAPGVNFRSQNHVEIRVEDARQLVTDGLAEVVNKGKDIRMFALTVLRMRQSLIFSTTFMHGVATGDPYCLRVWAWINEFCMPVRWRREAA